MLIENLKVFDDDVAPGVWTAPTFTSDRWNERLGHCSALAVQAVVSDVGPGGPGVFNLFVIHSADNLNWFVRSLNSPTTAYYDYGDIKIPTVASGGQYVRMYSDACRGISVLGSTVAGPLLPFVRISMFMTTVRARVQVHVTCRGPKRW